MRETETSVLAAEDAAGVSQAPLKSGLMAKDRRRNIEL
jgi:hypothetical protein